MKYKIFNISQQRFEADTGAIVTQDGKVAHWDDSAGWDVAEDQSDYEILLVVS